jgi:hypothetical protein
MDKLAIGAVDDAALGKAEGTRKGTPRQQRQFAASRLIKNHSSNHDARYNDFAG